MKKFIGYTRVSTSDQLNGLDAQLITINKWVEGKGVLVAHYEDMLSGKIDERIGLNNALDRCKKEGATLVIAKLDRLSRNVVFLFQIRDSGVELACCDLPELNTLTLGIFATMAQHERELIGRRTKEGMAVARSKGKEIGRKKGYKRKAEVTSAIAETKRIKILQKHHSILKYIRYFKGKKFSGSKILLELNEFGITHLKPYQIYRLLQLI